MGDENEFGILEVFDSENEVIKLYKNGECIFSWHDIAHRDWPEDLSWDRDIGSLFWTAFKLGIQHAKHPAAGSEENYK